MNKYKKGFAHIVFLAIGVLVLVGAIGTTAALIKRNSGAKDCSQGQVWNGSACEPISYRHASPNMRGGLYGSGNEMGDWQTFKNEKYSFNFKYPPTWKIQHQEDLLDGRNQIVFIADFAPTTAIEAWKAKNGNEALNLSDIQIAVTDLSPTEWYRRSYGSQPGQSEKDLIINGNNVHYAMVQNENYTQINYVVAGQGKIANFGINARRHGTNLNNQGIEWTEDYTEYVQEFEKIISTFKFTQKSETADWKTYNNKELGIQFSYPSNWRVGSNNLNSHQGIFQLFNYSEAVSGYNSSFGKGMNKIEMTILDIPSINFSNSENLTETKVSGQKAYRRQDSSVPLLTYTISLPPNSGKYLSVTMYGDSANYNVLESLIKTFKFTNKTIVSADTLKIIYPKDGQVWKIGSNQVIKINNPLSSIAGLTKTSVLNIWASGDSVGPFRIVQNKLTSTMLSNQEFNFIVPSTDQLSPPGYGTYSVKPGEYKIRFVVSSKLGCIDICMPGQEAETIVDLSGDGFVVVTE